MEHPLVPYNFNQFPVRIQIPDKGKVYFCLKNVCNSCLALISCAPVCCFKNSFIFLLLILALVGCSEPQTNSELVGSNFAEVLEEYDRQLIQREEEKCNCKLLTDAEIAALTEKRTQQFAKLY